MIRFNFGGISFDFYLETMMCLSHSLLLVCTRWKRTEEGTVLIRDGKAVLEFVAIRRKDTDTWAVPGVRFSI